MTRDEQARVAAIEARWNALATTIPGAQERFIANSGLDMGFLLALIRRLTSDAAPGDGGSD